MDTERNVLFGVLALQSGLIDADRFLDACTAWAARKDVPLAELMVGRGWLRSEDRAWVERLLEQRFILRYVPGPSTYIRASTHLFNTDEELEALAEAVRKL